MRLPAPVKVIVPFVASNALWEFTVPVEIAMVPSISLGPFRFRILSATNRVPSISVELVAMRSCVSIAIVTSVSMVKWFVTITSPPSVFVPEPPPAVRL